MTSTHQTDTPAWRSRYGPQQLRDLLGITEWQHARATASGVFPRPDAAGGKWTGGLARSLYARRVAIRRHAGTVPDVGAERAAQILARRLDIEVQTHAVAELARQGLLLVVDHFKDNAVYCGRTLETWTSREEVEQANTAGELFTADDAAQRLAVRRTDFDHLVDRGWIEPVRWTRGPYTAKKYRPDVPLYRAGDLDDLLNHPDIDWDAAQAAGRGQRSPLASLPDRSDRQIAEPAAAKAAR